MTITFLEASESPYLVDFSKYAAKKTLDLNTFKIQACAQRSLQLVGFFFVSLKDSVCTNLGSAGTSFKYIVLGYYGPLSRFRPPSDVYLAVFKVVFWVAAMGWGLSATTLRLFMEKVSSGHAILLKEFANDGINTEHLKTEELELNASTVPENITVNNLANLLDAINFTDSQGPGYMPPTTRKEADRTFTPPELRGYLHDFIRRVNTREAFLGTPPGYDIPRLMDFYQQIEDAVRLSIHKVTSDVEEFERINGTDYHSFDQKKKNEYNDLLQRRARVALDLAIAGAHCGARYMGEAMDVYYSTHGGDGQSDKDLQGTLLEILSQKRKEIAREHITQHFGNNTHAFSNYMGNMGKLIGIPGTKNIIEHLSRGFDTYKYLGLFFQAYTVDTIIDTVQEKIKGSQDLRMKITDWIRDQVGDWNHEEYAGRTQAIVQDLEKIRNISPENTSLTSHFEKFQILLADLKKEKVALPEIEDWNDFVTELLALNNVKEKLNELSGITEPGIQMFWRNTLKESLSEEKLGPSLTEELKQAIASPDSFTPIPAERYMPIFTVKAQIAEMKRTLQTKYGLQMDESTLSRVLDGKTDLREAVKNCQDQACRDEFLACFNQDQNLEEMDTNGISKELMEWLLVSQGVLTPQLKQECTKVNIDRSFSENYIEVVHQGFCKNPKTPIEAKSLLPLETLRGLVGREDEELIHKLSIHACATSGKRYSFAESKKERVLTWVFQQSFQHNSDEVIAAAEMASEGKEFYPKWKTVCFIQLPKIPANLLSSPFLKGALVVSTLAISFFSVYQAYEGVSRLFATKGLPFIINHVPVQVIRAGNSVLAAKDFVLKHSWKIILATWLFREGVARLPNIPYLSSTIRAINMWAIMNILWNSPQTLLGFAWDSSWEIAKGAWNALEEIRYTFRRISSNAEKERFGIYRKQSLDIWKQCYL